MTEEVSEQVKKKLSNVDWKDIGTTFCVTLVTAVIGCTLAVVIAQTLIIPAINKSKDKSAKEKEAAKK